LVEALVAFQTLMSAQKEAVLAASPGVQTAVVPWVAPMEAQGGWRIVRERVQPRVHSVAQWGDPLVVRLAQQVLQVVQVLQAVQVLQLEETALVVMPIVHLQRRLA